ncbi:MAG: hypothetical protein GX836_03610 [Spirochaetales bacterium]|nr:hypothetical protein [Spirochaetales bacterium]
MKQRLTYLGFFLTPFIPVIFYVVSAGTGYDAYALSIVFGVYAFVLVCNQFYLASQPAFLLKLLSAKQVRTLHSTSPLLLLALGGTHALLKLNVGFTLSTTQAVIGLLAFMLFFVGILSALMLFANTILTKRMAFAAIRTNVMTKGGLTHQKARAMHNLMVPTGLLVLAHVVLASTSDFTYNPWGMSMLVLWMVYSLLSYLNYRLSGRKRRGT